MRLKLLHPKKSLSIRDWHIVNCKIAKHLKACIVFPMSRGKLNI